MEHNFIHYGIIKENIWPIHVICFVGYIWSFILHKYCCITLYFTFTILITHLSIKQQSPCSLLKSNVSAQFYHQVNIFQISSFFIFVRFLFISHSASDLTSAKQHCVWSLLLGSRFCDLWTQTIISMCLALRQILDSHFGDW